MKAIEHFISNGDGWLLSLTQCFSRSHLAPGRSPVLIVPGYGVSSQVFRYHPSGLSMQDYLVQAGFEVWLVDLRGQGRSTSVGGKPARV